MVRDPSGLTSTAPLAAILCLALTTAVATAAAYAASPTRRLHRAVGWLGIVATVWLVVAGAISVGAIVTDTVSQARQSVVRVVTLPVHWWQYTALGFVGLGILGDVVAADRRARRRAVARAARTADGRFVDRLASRLDARVPPLIDELVPGRAAARDEATEAERARLAAELHAEVVPAVRRALAAVEAGGSVERLATDLRDVLGEVEGLLAQRRSIVLEELGLVAGLEWLAERVEERGSTRVTVDVLDASEIRPPRAVERAAFRVAALALDNVARHATGAAVAVTVLATAQRVTLSIEDDGPGITETRPAEARASGRRGLADMRAEAAAIGASLAFEAVEPHGTLRDAGVAGPRVSVTRAAIVAPRFGSNGRLMSRPAAHRGERRRPPLPYHRPVPKVAAIEIGQSPRPDLVEELAAVLPDDASCSRSAPSTASIRPRSADPLRRRNPLATRLADGQQIIVDEPWVAPHVQHAVDRAEEQRADALDPPVRGRIRRPSDDDAADRPAEAVARVLRAHGVRTILVVVPSPRQIPASEAKWRPPGSIP